MNINTISGNTSAQVHVVVDYCAKQLVHSIVKIKWMSEYLLLCNAFRNVKYNLKPYEETLLVLYSCTIEGRDVFFVMYEKIPKSVVSEFGLFVIDEERFCFIFHW